MSSSLRIRAVFSWQSLSTVSLILALSGVGLNGADRSGPESAKPRVDQYSVEPRRSLVAGEPLPAPLEVETESLTPIDLVTALSLVEVQNPEFLRAQQRVVEAMALRQLAAVRILPTINLGTNYDGHTGNLQQPNGNILSVKRSALYVGAGAGAVGSGTVNVPGVVWSLNISDSLFGYLQSRQVVAQRQFASAAARNDIGLRVAIAYLDLLGAEGSRSIALKVRDESAEVARMTAAYAKTGEGRQADAERAATELRDREANVLEAEGDAWRASSRLAELLSLDAAVKLHATDNWIVPHPIVPDQIPLPELLAISLLQRPELAERHAEIERALLALRGAKVLPFSPTVLVGFSAGSFGGGSNLVAEPVGSNPLAQGSSRFGNFSGRTDFDVITYWTLRNLGVGNRALVDAARSRLRSADLERVAVFDEIRAQVANAYTRTYSRFAQIGTGEEAVRTATDSWTEDLRRSRGHQGLPIEVLNSLRLLARARGEYLRAILEYNRAQFELYVALGQPPADLLVRSAGVETFSPIDE